MANRSDDSKKIQKAVEDINWGEEVEKRLLDRLKRWEANKPVFNALTNVKLTEKGLWSINLPKLGRCIFDVKANKLKAPTKNAIFLSGFSKILSSLDLEMVDGLAVKK